MLIRKKMCVDTLGPNMEENEFEFVVKSLTNNDLTKLLKSNKTFGCTLMNIEVHRGYAPFGHPYSFEDSLKDFHAIRLHTCGKLYHDSNVKRRIQSVFKERLCPEK